MTKANLRLHIAFDFELEAPETLLQLDQEALCRELSGVLGSLVLQGMPTISAKQLAKAGVVVRGHHHHLAAENTTLPSIPRELLIAAAPHLTDPELAQLSARAAGKQLDAAEPQQALRRLALAMVGDFRLVDCVLTAVLSSGKTASLEGRLNLTNGSVLIAEQDRQHRLQPKEPAVVTVPATRAALHAECSGHTLSGPVLAVSIAQLATARDELIAIWEHQA